MEGAVRVFAGELVRSTLTVPDGDDRSSAWVVTPSGAYCRQVFLAGALVEVQEQGGMLSARLADPTGGFTLVCGSSSTIAESIRKISLPAFVSVTGRTQAYRTEEGTVPAIRPDLVLVIDRSVRDQWVVTTAAATLERLEAMHRVMEGTCTDTGICRAFSHYSLATSDLRTLAEMVASALASVRPRESVAEAAVVDPRGTIMEFIRSSGGPRGVAVEEILEKARLHAISREGALAAIESLIMEDECYQPQKGFVKPL